MLQSKSASARFSESFSLAALSWQVLEVTQGEGLEHGLGALQEVSKMCLTSWEGLRRRVRELEDLNLIHEFDER